MTAPRRMVGWLGFALWLVAVSANAQDGRRGGAGPFHFDGLVVEPMRLLGAEVVQADLKLDDAAKAKIAEALTSYRSEMAVLNADISGLTREEVRKKFADAPEQGAERRRKSQSLHEEKVKQAEAALSADQTRRLKEIDLQLRGAAILNLPEVTDSLNLTDDQKTKLATIQSEDTAARRATLAGVENGRVIEEKVAELRKQTAEKAFAVLTDAQRDQLAKLKGQPIGFEAAQLAPRRPRVIRPR
jgi:hypothetical protein